jgi:hypothetical protein
MNEPKAPDSLPNYLAEGIPKQSDSTLKDLEQYVSELREYRDKEVSDDDLPESAEQVEDDDTSSEGTLVKEYVTCGDENCGCMDGGDKHGPYLYRYFYKNGSLTSEYVGKAESGD